MLRNEQQTISREANRKMRGGRWPTKRSLPPIFHKNVIFSTIISMFMLKSQQQTIFREANAKMPQQGGGHKGVPFLQSFKGI